MLLHYINQVKEKMILIKWLMSYSVIELIIVKFSYMQN